MGSPGLILGQSPRLITEKRELHRLPPFFLKRQMKRWHTHAPPQNKHGRGRV